VAHVDATSDDLIRQIERRHGDDAERLLRGRCQYITIWKPLRGPLHDYPLALCDFRSLDADRDLEPQDIVDRDEVLENVHVYHRPEHQWYYLSGQQDCEALVFRQADTAIKKFGGPTALPIELTTEHDSNKLEQGPHIAPYRTQMLQTIASRVRVSRLLRSSTPLGDRSDILKRSWFSNENRCCDR
jgi:hypothetical protein